MDKIIRAFETHEEADRASREDDAKLTTNQRLAHFLQMMAPVYESTARLQRVYRTRNLDEPEVRDRWRLG
jgi:CRP-like cAMP-binding protein